MIEVVHFTARWCRPCVRVAAVLAELAGRHPAVRFAEVDLDARPEAAHRDAVLALPTVLLLRDGEIVARLDGAHRKTAYERALAEVVPAAELGRDRDA